MTAFVTVTVLEVQSCDMCHKWCHYLVFISCEFHSKTSFRWKFVQKFTL